MKIRGSLSALVAAVLFGLLITSTGSASGAQSSVELGAVQTAAPAADPYYAPCKSRIVVRTATALHDYIVTVSPRYTERGNLKGFLVKLKSGRKARVMVTVDDSYQPDFSATVIVTNRDTEGVYIDVNPRFILHMGGAIVRVEGVFIRWLLRDPRAVRTCAAFNHNL